MDIKSKFRNWLVEQDLKPGTINSYLSRLKKISNNNWDMLTINIIPLLVKYYELSNKEYYIDRVTILNAVEYLKKISDYIYSNTNISVETNVKLYLFDGERDYFIGYSDLKVLHYDISLVSNYVYGNTNIIKDTHTYSIDLMKLNILILELQEHCQKELKSLALHIVYNQNGVYENKTVLTKYNNFLSVSYERRNYNSLTHQLLFYVKTRNPNKTVNKNFIQTRPITGAHARQVSPNPDINRDTEVGYVYSLRDLADIFNVDFYTAMDLMIRFGNEFTITTVINNYYSAQATNDCLNAYHHYKDKHTDEKYSNVDYTLEGYKQWCTRKQALEVLGIKKAAFYSHVARHCLYIDYAKGAPKYYIPELIYLKETMKIKRIRLRKNR